MFPVAFDALDYRCEATNSSTAADAYLTYKGQTSNVTLTPKSVGLAFVGNTSTMTINSITSAQTTPSIASLTGPKTSSPPTTSPQPAVPAGAVVGGAIGGVASLILAAWTGWLL